MEAAELFSNCSCRAAFLLELSFLFGIKRKKTIVRGGRVWNFIDCHFTSYMTQCFFFFSSSPQKKGGHELWINASAWLMDHSGQTSLGPRDCWKRDGWLILMDWRHSTVFPLCAPFCSIWSTLTEWHSRDNVSPIGCRTREWRWSWLWRSGSFEMRATFVWKVVAGSSFLRSHRKTTTASGIQIQVGYAVAGWNLRAYGFHRVSATGSC